KLMSMAKLKIAVGTVVVAGLGTTLVLEHRALARLSEQNAALQAELGQFAMMPERTEPISTRRLFKPRLPAPRMVAGAPATEAPADNAGPTSLLTRLLDGDEAFTLSLLQVESYLQDNRRSAESLLAAFRATDDLALLREAVEKYSDDPRVNLAAYFALRTESSPEDRRQRLAAFKQSAPDNALANFLSAQDHFNSGQTDQAVRELIAAAGKPKFQDYSGEFVQNAEEAYRAAGFSEADAKAVAAFGLLFNAFVALLLVPVLYTWLARRSSSPAIISQSQPIKHPV
ncbi:MAG: hypothetical protein ACYDC1_20310, partial [Limisphaerales bacterium]